MKRITIALLCCLLTGTIHAATGTSVSWSIGKASSSIDGIANAGPVTFTWTFDRPVTYGIYVDGTPWVIWENGLQLLAVSPAETVMDVPDYGTNTVTGCRMDLTCINLQEGELPLDQRMGGATTSGAPWGNGNNVWDGSPATLSVGDCIATGRGRRNSRSALRHMLFTAIGVCNIVDSDMTGYYRPPIRMPAHLRAALVTPQQVDVTALPTFDVPEPKNWAGSAVTLDYDKATTTYLPPDADDLLNGPQTVSGVYSYVWYEPGSAMLNHDLNGTDAAGYQRNVSDRFAACLYAAFDPDGNVARRQRNLDKFIQVGLDYFYQYCLGYEVWNGGGGHCDGIEGVITLSGAMLDDSTMTNAMKYQRFPGSAVGRGDTVVDMLSGSMSAFSRTEALYLVSAADWRSGDYVIRTPGSGAATLDECYVKLDLARDDHCINNEEIPFTALQNIDSCTAVFIDSSYVWPMWSRNIATEAKRSFRYILGGVVRLEGDARIRKVLDFKPSLTGNWTETSWNTDAQGQGGILYVYPALTSAEAAALGSAGTLTTGLCTRTEAENDEIALWESWAADSENRVLNSFFVAPTQDYLDNKLGDNFHWLPYYRILEDPGAPGKKLYEESAGYTQMVKFIEMQRDFGTYAWGRFTGGSNMPSTPTIQALTRHYLLDDTMSGVYCKTYDASDNMWNEIPASITAADDVHRITGPARPGLMTRAAFLAGYPGAVLYTLDGTPVTSTSTATGAYLVRFAGDAQARTIIVCD